MNECVREGGRGKEKGRKRKFVIFIKFFLSSNKMDESRIKLWKGFIHEKNMNCNFFSLDQHFILLPDRGKTKKNPQKNTGLRILICHIESGKPKKTFDALYIYIYIYIYIHYIYTNVNVHSTHTQTHTSTHIYIYIYKCVRVCSWVCVYACVCVCMYEYLYINSLYIYVYICV